MKEICGYLDLDNQFHKTKNECEIANSKIKIKKIVNKLDNFDKEVSQIIFLAQRNSQTPLHHIEKYVYEQVSKIILRDSKEFQKIIKDAKDLRNELELLRKEESFRWYFKFKWW